jgi:clan AA aspartic protease (TIGR02281 family)
MSDAADLARRRRLRQFPFGGPMRRLVWFVAAMFVALVVFSMPHIDKWAYDTAREHLAALTKALAPSVPTPDVPTGAPAASPAVVVIPSSPGVKVPLKKDGGIFVVPVVINGAITLDFTLDSGAANVSVPADVFSTLKRAGTIKDSDIVGEQTYVLADGSRAQSVGFKIRSLKIGSVTVENVSGSIAPSQGTLLLGQSFLERFNSWSIDNTKHELLLVP